MFNRTNVKFAVDLFASVAVILACGLVAWAGLSARLAPVASTTAASTTPAPEARVEDVSAEHLVMSLADAPYLGSASAPITVIEFSDFECPFCRSYSQNTFRILKQRFIDTGVISYAHVHLPLQRIHKSALAAARVAECASDQGKFWETHAGLFKAAASPGLNDASIEAVVKDIALDQRKLETCLMTVEERISHDLREAARVGIRGTPGFLIGTKSSDGNVAVRTRIRGVRSIDDFAAAINAVKNSGK